MVLVTENVTKFYGKDKVLDRVSISLEPGCIYGFIGNNGAGKTTLMRIISGLTKPTSGSLKLLGEETPKEISRARSKVGCLIESPVYYPEMSARDNLRSFSLLNPQSSYKQVDELLELVGLGSFRSKRVRDFSTGMKQRYGLAMALLGKPELLILDEPLNGLDVEGMDEICSILKDICTKKKSTILISSHLLARLENFATHYIFIDYGKIIEVTSAAELRTRVVGDLEQYFRDLVRHDMFSKDGVK